MQKHTALYGSPTNWWGYTGDQAFRHKDYPRAANCYRIATMLIPSDHVSWAHMGLCMLENKNNRAGLRYLRKAIRLAPDNPHYWHFLGTALNDMGRNREAVQAYYSVVKLDPKNPQTWNNFGTILWNAGQYNPAKESWKKALRLDPNNLTAARELAELYEITDSPRKGIFYRQKIVEIAPKSSKDWFTLGVRHFYLRRYDKAREAFERAAEVAPRNKKFLYWLGLTFDRLDMYSQSVDCFFRAGSILRWKDQANLDGSASWLANNKNYDAAQQVHSRMRGLENEKVRKLMGQYRPGETSKEIFPRIISATIDLKLTPDGSIKIFEFNDLWRSGAEGYQRLTGKDLHEDVLRPHRRKLTRSLRQEKIKIQEIKVPGDDLFHRLAFYARSIANPNSRILFENTDSGFLALCDNKDFLASKTSSPELQDYFPRTLVLPVGTLTKQQITAKLNKTFGRDESANLVVKPPDGLQGRGVNIMSADTIADFIVNIPKGSLPDDRVGDFWNTRPLSTVLVQDCIQSQPVKAADGQFYDGTMRVAFTAVLHPDSAVPDIHFHTAWWKLPKDAISSQITRESVVSFAPCDLDGQSKKSQPFSAKVDPQQRKHVESKLRTCLAALIPSIVATREELTGEIKGFLTSPDDATRVMGTRLATNTDVADYLVMAAGPSLKKEFLKQIALNFRTCPTDASAAFVRNLQQAFATPHASGKQFYTLNSVGSYIDPRPDFLPN